MQLTSIIAGVFIVALLTAAASSFFTGGRTTAADATGCRRNTGLLEQVRDWLSDVPHDVPELEAMLPMEVDGRRLRSWSTQRARFFEVLHGLGGADIRAVADELETEGVALDDIQYAVAGRSDVAADPPYLAVAFRAVGGSAVMTHADDAADFPGVGSWTPRVIGGREVLVGTEAMIDQSTGSVRGRPYVYDVGDVRFVVTTDDEAWAAEAIARLCPDPDAEAARPIAGRLERSDLAIALRFPHGWVVDSISGSAQRRLDDLQGDPDGLHRTVAYARQERDGSCSVDDVTRLAQTPPPTTSLDEFAADAERWAAQDVGVVEVIREELDMLGGEGALIYAVYEDGSVRADYIVTDRSSWFRLSCMAAQPPEDRWRSIAETIEFRPR